MDPDAALRRIIEAAVSGDGRELDVAAAGLVGWLDGGGYPPNNPLTFPRTALYSEGYNDGHQDGYREGLRDSADSYEPE